VSETLHPLVAHHVLNSLGWADLRPLQKAALGPITAGQHVLLVAPTAGGKTEAAIFPMISRMLSEDWQPMSVLYLCPLRALLNNLHPRIEQYATLVGRGAGLWHGDVGESARETIRDDPPDILLTTPESIEAMLISRKTDHEHLFRHVRALVVDEIHAFAGDDRGWHLLAVAERVQRLAGRELQRVGLSATIGNADAILAWLTRTSRGPGTVIAPPAGATPVRPDVTVDYVGALDNAASVISRLHRGEKRLVFVDSRARAEQLAADLRNRDVQTFVSHGSLGREERHAAESAFASSRDCVIVATSTLELGIDVGDLDRVIQIDAPATVASFLQRLGRTGRREGATSNMLFLATREDTFLHTLGLLTAWEEGYVEPLEPPPLPLHLLVQQLLALVLQEGGVGRATWADWLGSPLVLGKEAAACITDLTTDLVAENFLFDDSGILGIGERGERTFGVRNFLDLMAIFSEPPMLKVLAGRTELGQVPLRLLTLEAPDGHVILLGGRDWRVLDVDWRRGIIQVEPAERRGKVRWFGEGRGLSFPICQGIKKSLAGKDLGTATLSRRGTERLETLRYEFHWVEDEPGTVVLKEPDGTVRWWTFAGSTANSWLSTALGELTDQVAPGDLSIRLAPAADVTGVSQIIVGLEPAELKLGEQIARGAVDRLKFAEALPEKYAHEVVERRMREDEVLLQIKETPLKMRISASEAAE
jgi:ATP-dependent helicase Lhr and Lhr-like helicase